MAGVVGFAGESNAVGYIFSARLLTSLGVELVPGLRLHGDGASDGRAAFGVFPGCAFWSAGAFALTSVGGGFTHIMSSISTSGRRPCLFKITSIASALVCCMESEG